MIDDLLKADILKLLHLAVKDGLDTDSSEERMAIIHKAGNLYVQLLKIDAKMPEDDDENNFGVFQGKLKAIEGGK